MNEKEVSSKVVSLLGNAIPGEAAQGTVELIEEMLAKAKSGEIRSIAVAAIKANGNATTRWSHESEFIALTGAVSWLLHRMHQE